jgi:hypothetical protein
MLIECTFSGVLLDRVGPMSRKAVTLTLLLYIAVALAFGFVIEMMRPSPFTDFRATGNALGDSLRFFLLSGAVPLIFWASNRFKPEQATCPLIAWALLAVFVGYLDVINQ